MNEKFVFVIDTENYAGNFEREMCAFCTGQIGDCEVGEEESMIFKQEMNENLFDEKIESRIDDNGCWRPTSIWATPGWFNNGNGGHFRVGQEEEALLHRNEEYEKCGKQYGREDDYKARCNEPLKEFPAYQSVAIFFNERPTEEELNIIIERAKRFVTQEKQLPPHRKQKIIITGFRLLREVQTEEEIWNFSDIK